MPLDNAGDASAETDANEPAVTEPPTNVEGRENAEGQGAETGLRNPDTGKKEAKEESDAVGAEELDLASHLNLSPEVRKQISEGTRTKDTKETKAKKGGSSEADGSDEGPAGERQSEEQEHGEDHESATADSSDGEQEGEDEDGAELPRDARKLQKRVGRLTKKLRHQESVIAAYEAERQQGQNGQRQQPSQPAPPGSHGILGQVRSEQQLDTMVGEAEALIDFVAANPDGWTEGEGERAVFHPPEELKAYQREAEKLTRGAEARRRQLREFQGQRQTFDRAARTEWPELFDRESKEYQAAVLILRELPAIREHPSANFALGIMIEGYKARAARQNGNGKKPASEANSDLDPRLDPEHQRNHIPPTTKRPAPNAPGRAQNANGAPKKIAAATEAFTRPGGNTAMGLARIFESMDDEETDPARKRVAV